MAYRLPPLASLTAFEAAARHLSFKHAAAELHVTPAAVSQQIKNLENYLGVELFRRLTRALELTDQGIALLPKIRAGLDVLAAAVARPRASLDRTLTVAAPPLFATHWLLPRLPGFSVAHPEIAVRLSSQAGNIDRCVPFPGADGAPGEGHEDGSRVAIRFGTGRYPGCHVDRVFAATYVPVCSPRLLTGKRPLRTPRDLRWHVLLHDETIPQGENWPNWAEWLKVAGAGEVDATRGPRFSDSVLALEAALAGQGVALALRPMVEANVRSGHLAIPFAAEVPSPDAYYLVVNEGLAQRNSVTAFRAWLMAEAGSPNAGLAASMATR